MTLSMWLVLALLAAALVAFARQWAPPEIVSLTVLGALIVTGLLDTQEALSGFSHPAVVTVVAMFVLGAALVRTGAAQAIGRGMGRVGGGSEIGLVMVTMATAGVMSAFMNNIGACAILLPVVHTMARDTGVVPTRLLIPLSFGSLLGGLTTLIGTPPNLIASTLLTQYGHTGFRMFDFLPTGLAVMGAGILYMALVGRHLLPRRPLGQDLFDKYRVKEFLTEVTVRPKSRLVDKSLAESGLGAELGLSVLGVVREHQTVLSPPPAFTLRVGDVLIVESSVEDLMKVRKMAGLDIHPEAKLSVEDLESDDVQVMEALVAPRSRLSGRTPKQAAFRHRYGLTILAIRRQGRTHRSRLHETPLQFGDTLLIQGRKDRFEELQADPTPDLLVFGPLPYADQRVRKVWTAVAVMTATVVIAATGLLPIAGASTVGALAMVLLGCLKAEEAYEAIEWRIIFLIGAMLPLGLAMEKTGTAAFLAGHISETLAPLGPLGVMAGLYVATTLLTQALSNAAAAVLMVPLGISAAVSLGVAPHGFVMAITIAASTAFLTPIGHQANVLVYGAGGYRFNDFTRVGLPLNLVLLVVTLAVTPRIWPF